MVLYVFHIDLLGISVKIAVLHLTFATILYSFYRKARVPLHITRQPIVEDGPVMDMEGEEDTAFFDAELPSTSTKAQCNGMDNDAGNATAQTDDQVQPELKEPELPEGKHRR